MTISAMQKIGLKKAFLKYKFDLLEERKNRQELEIIHKWSMFAIGCGISLCVLFLFVRG